MSDDIRQFKCARCNCALEAFPDAKPEPRAACPKCGEGDTIDNVVREIGDHMMEQLAQGLNQTFTEAARTSKNVKFTPTFKPKGGHRFIVDRESH